MCAEGEKKRNRSKSEKARKRRKSAGELREPPGQQESGKAQGGKEAEIQTFFDVALQLLGLPAPQPCSPGALEAGPTGEAS